MNERYSRQIILTGFGEAAQNKLLNSSCAIIGCGGLGAIAASYLAGAGISRIILIDGDLPSISNLHRQVFYKTGEEQTKSNALKEHLENLNPEIKIEAFSKYLIKENIDELITGVDVVLECSDDIQCKYLVNDFCVIEQIPLIYGAIYQYEGYVSVFSNQNNDDIHLRDIFPVPDDKLPKCADVGVMNTIAGMIGILQANEAIKVITGIGEALIGKMLTYNTLDNRQMILKLKKNFTEDLEELFENNSYSIINCDVPIISISQYIENSSDYILVSVMPTEEHISISKEVINIPIDKIESHQFNDNKSILCYCRSGRISRIAVEKLLSKNKNLEVFSLDGGYKAYQKFKALN